MKLQDLRQDNLDITEIEKDNVQSNEWLISYSDLVTVLLCFFIMFFVIKARQQEKDYLETVARNSKKELILSDVTTELKKANLSAKAEIQKFDRHLSMHLRNKVFTDSGELSLDGQYLFTELASIVYPFMPSVQLQISVGEASVNGQAGLLRALEIRKYLIELGLSQELIAIGNFKRSPAAIEENENDEIKIIISRNHYEKTQN